MIIIKEISAGKINILNGEGILSPPFTSNAYGNKVVIEQLKQSPGQVSGDYTEFRKSTDLATPFASVEALTDYLGPFMGFKAASGGSGASYISAAILKTGQVLSHYPNDDGQLQSGRLESFSILPGNNPFGNINRFTDLSGGSTYPDPITLDWSTFDGGSVLAYYLDIDVIVDDLWTDMMDYCQALIIGGYSGWRMPNAKEILNVCQYVDYGFAALGYAPFNILSADAFWTSTNSADHAMFVSNVWGTLSYAAKTATARTVPVRLFTLNELGL